MNVQYGNQSLDTDDKLAYDFSQQSYKKEGKRTNVGEYEYDPELSNVNTGVWHDQKAKKTHVSNRGSVTAGDWFSSDFAIGLGREDKSKRFQQAVDTTSRAHAKYGFNVSTSGHSLGNSLANYTTEKLGNNDWYDGSTGFNSGVSSIGRGGMFSKQRRECSGKNPPKYCNKAVNIKEKGDYFSNNNIACDYLTFGYGGSLCRKSDPFGKTKTYDHRKNQRWAHRLTQSAFPPLRYFNNARKHSLGVFG
jgi:hypothetical protein